MKRSIIVTAAIAVGMATFAAHTMNRPADPVALQTGVSPLPNLDQAARSKAAPERKKAEAPQKKAASQETAVRKKDNVDGLTTAAVPFKVLPQLPGLDEAGARDAADAARGASGPTYGAIVARFAAQYDVPEKLILAVIEIESAGQADLVGRAGEVGLMQIKPTTARGMGYKGPTKALFDPETNIRWGMTYLAKAHDLADGDICGTILRYNAGHSAKRMNKRSAAYCRKVIQHMGS